MKKVAQVTFFVFVYTRFSDDYFKMDTIGLPKSWMSL